MKLDLVSDMTFSYNREETLIGNFSYFKETFGGNDLQVCCFDHSFVFASDKLGGEKKFKM